MATKGSYTDYKRDLYRHFARVGRAVANPHRLEVLDLLSQGERTVDDLALELDTTISNTSQHLQVLRTAGLVTSRKEGLFVHYSLASNHVGEFWRSLRALSLDLSAEARELIQSFVHERDRLEPVNHEELLRRVQSGRTVVIDVRPGTEYDAGHIPGALSIPLDQLTTRIKEIPSGADVVAYCRGPYCLLSVDAVNILRERGHQAHRLVDGFPEWRASGLEVAQSAKDSMTRKDRR
jgi:rhodanese-related sulfurtransferase